MADDVNVDDYDTLVMGLKSTLAVKKRAAAKNLGSVPNSSREIIEALVAARDTDWDYDTRVLASAALASPVHQAFIRQNPDLLVVFQQHEPVQARLIESAAPVLQPSSPKPTFSWLETWRMAITKPNLTTYERIVNDAQANGSRARKWLVSTLFVMFIVVLGVGTMNLIERSPAAALAPSSPNLLGILVVSVIFAALGVFLAMVGVIVVHAIARGLGGTGQYSKMLYAFAAYNCPLFLLEFIGVLIPITWRLPVSTIFTLYGAWLSLLAVRAVYLLGWGRAFFASVVPGVAAWLFLNSQYLV